MIKEDIQILIDNAEVDLLNEHNPDLKKAVKSVKDWIDSPSCPLVDEDELEEEVAE